MNNKSFSSFIGSLFGITFIVLIVFGVLKWMDVPRGDVIDWGIGIASFWWLMIIVTVPWNLYFHAKSVLDTAANSKERDIKIKESEVQFVQKLKNKAIVIALTLHIASAIGLYLISYFKISPVGYISSVAALLLTLLRPAIRAHDYIVARLSGISREFRYPADDLFTFKTRVGTLESKVESLEKMLDSSSKTSKAYLWSEDINNIRYLAKQIESKLDNLDSKNQKEHENLKNETAHAVAQLTLDGKFIEHLREIIRFFKNV
ncbi:hypothetical protein JXR93_03545 [bacterium]|nr:hypothetical protein [bacterium]